MSTPGSRSGEEMPIARRLPGLELARDLVEAAGRDRDLAADDERQHLAAGADRDVVHLLDVAAAGLDHEAAEEVVGRAGREAAPAHRTRVLRELGEEVLDGLDRRVRGDEQRLVLALEPRQGRDLLRVTGALLMKGRADEAEAGDEKRRIALLGVGEARESDGAAGARHVDDLDARHELLGHQHFLQSSARAGRSRRRGRPER